MKTPQHEIDFERRLIELGANAPRVTPEMVTAAIVKDEYTLLQDGRTTICLLTLYNGFTVRGESSCAHIDNYREEAGKEAAYRKARDGIWKLLAFRLVDREFETGMFDRISNLSSVHEAQNTDGTWNTDAYHRGIANGLELALSLLEDRPPNFKAAPAQYMLDKKENNNGSL